MYIKTSVKIPNIEGKIIIKKQDGNKYVYYIYEREYNQEKRYTKNKSTTIGKVSEEDETKMYPNANYAKYFPEEDIPGVIDKEVAHCRVLKTGAYIVIKKIIERYGIEEIIRKEISNSGLLLDLATYSIITEDNAAQYYPNYAYEHPLFTKEMQVYSDASVGEFLNKIKREQVIKFLDEWNRRRKKKEKIYITYDSTNKKCEAGDINLVEVGHFKEKEELPIFNYSIAYDERNKEPLFYEEYPGSIVDISQLQCMLEKASGYGYKNAGFILDRGYFSKGNIKYMDEKGYSFVIMMKGNKDVLKELIEEVHGKFEDKWENTIRDYSVSGYTIKRKLREWDEKERYFHIYYSDMRKTQEREELESKLDKLKKYFNSMKNKEIDLGKAGEEYFKLVYLERNKKKIFMGAELKLEEINKAIGRCGYFAIITSDEMSAEEAIHLYKGRDVSEKLFRADKSFLGNKTMRVHSEDSLRAKIFVEFIALIIRNKIYTTMKEYMKEKDKKYNYLTVPAAIQELEKIEIYRPLTNRYQLDHAITRKQKEILSIFEISEEQVKKEIIKINAALNAKNN